jgi:VWFA-related protein
MIRWLSVSASIRVWRTLAVLITISFPSLSTTAQETKNASKSGQELVVRTTTRLVLVNVVVHDKQGRPVTDLTKDDFVLLEESKPQKIDAFSVESRIPEVQSNLSLPPNTYTNRLAGSSAAMRNVSLILLDSLNTNIQDQAYARQRLVKFLEQIQSQDRIAIYSLSSAGVRIIHDFSNDASSLLAALRLYRERFSIEAEPPVLGVETLTPVIAASDDELNDKVLKLEEFIKDAKQAIEGPMVANRVMKTISVLEAIANSLARFQGRKNLIWVSAGFPLLWGGETVGPTLGAITAGGNFTRQTDEVTRVLGNANITVYSVDARGLIGALPRAGEQRSASSPGLERSRTSRTQPYADSTSGTNSLNVLAQNTGGRAFFNRNDVDRAIRDAVEDSHVSYTLGYYPMHGKWDGKFRAIKVKVNRPGMEIRARNGYFAADLSKLKESELIGMLQEAADSPFDLSGVGLAVRAEAVDTGGTRELRLSIDIDPRDVTLFSERGYWVGGINLMLLQRTAEGAGVARLAQTFDLKFSPEEYAQLQANGLILDHQVEIDSHALLLRVVVRDSHTGSLGTVSVPIAKRRNHLPRAEGDPLPVGWSRSSQSEDRQVRLPG